MKNSRDSIKSFTNYIATIVKAPECVDAIRLLRAAGLLGGRQVGRRDRRPDKQMTESSENGTRVGIWQRNDRNGEFLRSQEFITDWQWWANVGRIEAKRTTCRVVLIGESVARGYLYDPQFTPTQELQRILRSQLGENQVEVVDLAMTGMTLSVLKHVTMSAHLLSPDVIVVFAGNNWAGDAFESVGAVTLAAALRQGGVGQMKRSLEDALSDVTRAAVREIASSCKQRGVPVVWVVPEFNLMDWRDPIAPAPLFLSGGNNSWLLDWENAESALKRKDYQVASQIGQKLVEQDGGTSVAGFYILATCSQHSDDLESARSYLTSARDAVIWDFWDKSPRMYAAAQNALREEARQVGWHIVDLPEIFGKYLAGDLPDRRLFIDYCHLTAKGIQVAMAATASCVFNVLRGDEVSWTDVLLRSTDPPTRVQAEAEFLAAVYNAHWNQPGELLQYYCSRSLHLCPDIASVMKCFLNMQTVRAPMLLSRAAEEIAAYRFPSIQKYLLRSNLHLHQLDSSLIEAIVSALLDSGIDVREETKELRITEHSVTGGVVDLLDYYYCSSSLQPQDVQIMRKVHLMREPQPIRQALRPRGDYFRAHSRESRFVFIGEAGHALNLSLTARVPHAGGVSEPVSIRVNGGKLICNAILSSQWQTLSLAIGGEVVGNGTNEVILRWPAIQSDGPTSFDLAAQELMGNLIPELYPIFGEIHSLTISLAGHWIKKQMESACACHYLSQA